MTKQQKREQDYKKELNRIRRFIKKAEAEGFEIPEDIIPEKPKKITDGSIRRLKNITADFLNQKITVQEVHRVIEEETGEYIGQIRGKTWTRGQVKNRARIHGQKIAEERFDIKAAEPIMTPSFYPFKVNDIREMVLTGLSGNAYLSTGRGSWGYPRSGRNTKHERGYTEADHPERFIVHAAQAVMTRLSALTDKELNEIIAAHPNIGKNIYMYIFEYDNDAEAIGGYGRYTNEQLLNEITEALNIRMRSEKSQKGGYIRFWEYMPEPTENPYD